MTRFVTRELVQSGMTRAQVRRKRSPGAIDQLPSGVLRVRVYAGVDAVAKRRINLTEIIPAGPKAQVEAEKALTRLLRQVDERRYPRTTATVHQLMDRWLKVLDVEASTRQTYEGYIRKHIRPLLGSQQAGKLDSETLDSSTQSCAGVENTVPAASCSSTGQRTPMTVTSTSAHPAVPPVHASARHAGAGAGHTNARDSPTQASARSTLF
jgi:hypothetical protein